MADDPRSQEEINESYRYWAKQSAAAVWDETVRLSVEKYGKPIGDIRDGPFVRSRLMPDGSRQIISKWSGPNPLRHETRKT